MQVFLLHGMGGGSHDWGPNLPGQRLEIPELPSLTACVESLADTISAQASTIGLCGYSLGGRLALLLSKELLARGLRVKKLALLSSGLGELAGRQERQKIDESWATLATSDRERFWQEWYAQELFASFHALPLATREAWLRERKAININRLTNQLVTLSPAQHGDLRPLLEEVIQEGVSVLYLAGDLDKKYKKLADSLRPRPGLAVAILPRAGHTLPLEAPIALAERLQKFFAD